MNDTERFEAWEKKLSAYSYAMTLHGLDGNNAPVQGRKYRESMAVILASEMFEIEHDETILPVLERLSAQDEDPVLKQRAQLRLNRMKQSLSVRKEDYEQYRKVLAESIEAWLKYKPAADWKSYAPYLQDLVQAYRALQKPRLQEGQKLYDLLLDDHEKGWDTVRYDAFFKEIRTCAVSLLEQIRTKDQIDDSFLHQYYPADKQRAFMPQILKYMGFSEEWGRISESEHPLTTPVTAGDIRFTTKYREHDVSAAILSSVHEIGHAWFGHQIDPAYEGTILARAMSAGLHESQSRLCENHLGRSTAFWQYNLPLLQEVFPAELAGITPETFCRALNRTEATLVRTQADELTYPLHIMIRYEIEKMMFSDDPDILHLDEVWNQMYHEYLGLEVPDAQSGILQDMHWPYAYFGYFPTYALGSAFAAQFNAAMRKDINVDDLLREGRTEEIFAWLKEHVQHWGAFLSTDEIIRRACGEDFSPRFWTEYITKKYTELYRL